MENKRNLKKMPDILAMLERSNNTAQLAAESLQYALQQQQKRHRGCIQGKQHFSKASLCSLHGLCRY
jgi:hypothetical protein